MRPSGWFRFIQMFSYSVNGDKIEQITIFRNGTWSDIKKVWTIDTNEHIVIKNRNRDKRNPFNKCWDLKVSVWYTGTFIYSSFTL